MHVLDARTNSGAHEAEVARLREAYAALPPGAPVRLAKRTSNLFRFRDFPNSYATLGYSLSLTIELEPVRPYVHLRHFAFDQAEACMEAVSQIAAEGSYRGHKADFLDGTAFAPDELYLTVGAYSDLAPWRSDYTGQQIY